MDTKLEKTIGRNVDNFPEWVKSLSADKKPVMKRLSVPDIGGLHWAAIGITKEAAEVMEHISDHIFYGSKLDGISLIDELGDILFHIQTICNILNCDITTVMAAVAAKNTVRYPDGFNEKSADRAERNKAAEREAIRHSILKRSPDVKYLWDMTDYVVFKK